MTRDTTHDDRKKRVVWAVFPLYIRNAVVSGSAVKNMRMKTVEASKGHRDDLNIQIHAA